MRTWQMFSAASLLALTLAGCGAGDEEDRYGAAMRQQAVPAVQQNGEPVLVTPEQAQQIARRQVQGTVVETDLVQQGEGPAAYAVTIQVPGEPDLLRHTVFVNSGSGEVVRVEDRAALQEMWVEVPQEDALAAALEQVSGTVTATTLMNLDGRPVYQFEVMADDDAMQLAYVDANTGEFVKSEQLLQEFEAPPPQGGDAVK